MLALLEERRTAMRMVRLARVLEDIDRERSRVKNRVYLRVRGQQRSECYAHCMFSFEPMTTDERLAFEFPASASQ